MSEIPNTLSYLFGGLAVLLLGTGLYLLTLKTRWDKKKAELAELVKYYQKNHD